ncbi:hypothetical protein [Oxobacter pfennigii]|nr:hypothetical protein [Oxobacter pfennigii]
MGNIKCFQCGYFNTDKCCSRYNISVDKENICVDSDESPDKDK